MNPQKKGVLPFVGIDDFAFKKRFTYSIIIIDLVTHQPLDILPTRESSDVTAWLKRYPDIKVVSRVGSKSYAKAIKDAYPDIKSWSGIAGISLNNYLKPSNRQSEPFSLKMGTSSKG